MFSSSTTKPSDTKGRHFGPHVAAVNESWRLGSASQQTLVTGAQQPAFEATDMSAPPSKNRLADLFERHASFVWRTLRRLGVDDAGADDGCQEVFLVADRKLASIQQGSERSYLFGIAVRVASDIHRSRRRKPWHAASGNGDVANIASPATDAGEQLDQHKARQLLDSIVVEMPQELRVVFVSYELENLTMAEIAEALNVAPGTIASRLRRARELFQKSVVAVAKAKEAP
jgi:RNA polymerase sigma-70 factor, ECF subfamily